MASVTYTALRSIIAGHTSGTAYTIDFNAQVLDRSKKAVSNKSQSLGGQTEILRVRKDVFWAVTSDYITEADRPQWEEFLDSVDAGEAFTFDAYGTSASPDNAISVELDSADYDVKRVDAIQYYTFTFKVREL